MLIGNVQRNLLNGEKEHEALFGRMARSKEEHNILLKKARYLRIM